MARNGFMILVTDKPGLLGRFWAMAVVQLWWAHLHGQGSGKGQLAYSRSWGISWGICLGMRSSNFSRYTRRVWDIDVVIGWNDVFEFRIPKILLGSCMCVLPNPSAPICCPSGRRVTLLWGGGSPENWSEHRIFQFSCEGEATGWHHRSSGSIDL